MIIEAVVLLVLYIYSFLIQISLFYTGFWDNIFRRKLFPFIHGSMFYLPVIGGDVMHALYGSQFHRASAFFTIFFFYLVLPPMLFALMRHCSKKPLHSFLAKKEKDLTFGGILMFFILHSALIFIFSLVFFFGKCEVGIKEGYCLYL